MQRNSLYVLPFIFLVINLLLPSQLFAQNAIDNNEVHWKAWSPETFKQAQAQNKMLLINVGMEGCTACNRMEQQTYRNPEVIKLINTHFVAISVDSQARPDVGERYSDWGWPATAFLMPDATQVFAMAGNRFPRNFIPILKDLIEKQEKGTLEPDPQSPYSAPPKQVTSPLTELRDTVRRQLDRTFNRRVGGWTYWGLNAESAGARLRHLYLRAHLRKDESQKQGAIKVSEAYLRTIDPVWGGAFEAAIHEDVERVPEEYKKIRVIPEKRISGQANAIIAFADAYSVTQDERFRSATQDINRYLEKWMKSPQGTWYANQKNAPKNLPDDWWPQDYWMLDTHEARMAYGAPPIDHAVYTDKNAEVIIAYLRAYEVFGNKDYLNIAQTAAKQLIQERLHNAGWIRQSVSNEKLMRDNRVHPHSDVLRPFLRTQARFGLALSKLYQVTADKQWLSSATRIADAALTLLLDEQRSGFWPTTLDSLSTIIKPRKPLEDNALMAQFFYELYVLTKEAKYEFIPEKTIRAVATDVVLSREGKVVGETALLLEKLTAHYLEFTVVTHNSEDPEAQALYQAAFDTYHPRKVMHFELPGRYPDLNKPALFICNPNRCTLPIFSPEKVAKAAAGF